VELPIRANELLSIRNASRNLYDAVAKLQRKEARKFVLLNNRNEMQAVLLTPQAYAALLSGQGEVAGEAARRRAA
jgi:hypothetical protein